MRRMVFKLSRKQITKLSIVVACLVLAGGTLGLARGGKAGQKAAPAVARPALTVRTTTLQEEKWARTLQATGSIIPWQEAIITAQVQGLRIADVRVSIGDHVEQGEVLVTLDNLARAGDTETRSVQGRIIAPDAGVISAANATVGSMSQPGMELFRLIRRGRLEWRADLTAEELMLLRKGMTVEVTVGEGRVIKGIVRAIAPSVDPKTRYGYALISLPESSGIVAGAFARGVFDLSGGRKNMQTLPQSALMRRGSEAFVLVIDADHHVHERPVTAGKRYGERIQIVEGLHAKEPVVETGGAFLTEGDVVQVVSN